MRKFFGGSYVDLTFEEIANRDAEEAAAIQTSKAAVWERIKAKRDAVTEGGVLVSGKWFHSDSRSRTQQLGLVLMGASVPSVQWKTMDGSFATMSQALAMGIFNAVATQDMAAFAAAETHRAAMLVSVNPSAYDYSSGWPAVYA